DALLDRSLAAPSILLPPSPPAGEPLVALAGAIAAVEAQLGEIEAHAGRSATAPRLERLRALFGLSDFERDVVLIALAAEIDLKYERLFAYLQDDVTKKRPTVDLALR